MTEFTDGPAAGKVLLLRRHPLFLRVTRTEPTGRQRVQQFDALDRLTDEPEPGETLFAYRRTALSERAVHIRVARGASGWYRRATYTLHPEQPVAAIVAASGLWRDWCMRAAGKRRDCGGPQESS